MVQWLKAILLLPLNVLIFIPSIVLYFSNTDLFYKTSIYTNFIGITSLSFGLALAIWTMFLFYKIGKGTPAPWSPTKKLIIKGPYQYVRNPMITSVILMLIAETLLINSVEILCWLGMFTLINIIYFPLFEEKGLIKRFGKEYLEYKNNVPRWIPRLTKWKKDN